MVSTMVVPYGVSRRVLYAVWRVECSVYMNSGTMTVFAAVHRPARENCVAQRSAAAWTATLHVYRSWSRGENWHADRHTEKASAAVHIARCLTYLCELHLSHAEAVRANRAEAAQ